MFIALLAAEETNNVKSKKVYPQQCIKVTKKKMDKNEESKEKHNSGTL